MATCTGPKCAREAVVDGLCDSHRKQRDRGRDLSPLRTAAGVKIPGLTVSAECAAHLAAAGPTTYEAARAVLERWARRR
jgi:hypothetical protein